MIRTLCDRWRLAKLLRYRYRARVSRWASRAHREQTDRILEKYPDPEPMPLGEWLREFADHLKISLRRRWLYRRADLVALRQALFLPKDDSRPDE